MKKMNVAYALLGIMLSVSTPVWSASKKGRIARLEKVCLRLIHEEKNTYTRMIQAEPLCVHKQIKKRRWRIIQRNYRRALRRFRLFKKRHPALVLRITQLHTPLPFTPSVEPAVLQQPEQQTLQQSIPNPILQQQEAEAENNIALSEQQMEGLENFLSVKKILIDSMRYNKSMYLRLSSVPQASVLRENMLAQHEHIQTLVDSYNPNEEEEKDWEKLEDDFLGLAYESLELERLVGAFFNTYDLERPEVLEERRQKQEEMSTNLHRIKTEWEQDKRERERDLLDTQDILVENLYAKLVDNRGMYQNLLEILPYPRELIQELLYQNQRIENILAQDNPAEEDLPERTRYLGCIMALLEQNLNLEDRLKILLNLDDGPEARMDRDILQESLDDAIMQSSHQSRQALEQAIETERNRYRQRREEIRQNLDLEGQNLEQRRIGNPSESEDFDRSDLNSAEHIGRFLRARTIGEFMAECSMNPMPNALVQDADHPYSKGEMCLQDFYVPQRYVDVQTFAQAACQLPLEQFISDNLRINVVAQTCVNLAQIQNDPAKATQAFIDSASPHFHSFFTNYRPQFDPCNMSPDVKKGYRFLRDNMNTTLPLWAYDIKDIAHDSNHCAVVMVFGYDRHLVVKDSLNDQSGPGCFATLAVQKIPAQNKEIWEIALNHHKTNFRALEN
jgi:hypothetical protein